MKRYEYKTVSSPEIKGMLGAKLDLEGYDKMLNEYGKDGWELAETTALNWDGGKTKYIICVFKREI